MQSQVGNARIHEAGDQRRPKETNVERGMRERKERHEHPSDSVHHTLHSDDDKSFLNTMNPTDKRESLLEENRRTVGDPLRPAMDHGNKPSRGAQVDADLQREDREMLQKKDKTD